jgi:hypothetical protein
MEHAGTVEGLSMHLPYSVLAIAPKSSAAWPRQGFTKAIMSFRSWADRSFSSKNGMGPGVVSVASIAPEGGYPDVRTFCAILPMVNAARVAVG